jgi:glutamate-5-semialdehyde dehydrogenase
VTTDVATSAADAKSASRKLASEEASQRNSAIRAAAEKIAQCRGRLLGANAKDLGDARQLLASGEISGATFERLRLTDEKILEMTRSMLAVAELPDKGERSTRSVSGHL